MEPRHYKLEWLSMLGAVSVALVLLAVAYFINNHEGFQKIAFICIVIAGFTVTLCLVSLLVHLYVTRKKRPKPDNDAPPSYKVAWRRDFFSRRMSEAADQAESVPGTSATAIPLSDFELQPASLPGEQEEPEDSSSTRQPESCATDLPPPTPHTTGGQISRPSVLPFYQKPYPTFTGKKRIRRYSYDEYYSTNDPPSYEEAMQSIDLSCLQSLRFSNESEDDE